MSKSNNKPFRCNRCGTMYHFKHDAEECCIDIEQEWMNHDRDIYEDVVKMANIIYKTVSNND